MLCFGDKEFSASISPSYFGAREFSASIAFVLWGQRVLCGYRLPGA